MLMKNYNPQICVCKNKKNLIEFTDAMYFETDKAWPEADSSRIRLAINDYSDRSKKAVYKWNNLTVTQIKELLRKSKKIDKCNTKYLLISKSTLEKALITFKNNPGVEPEELKILEEGLEQITKEIEEEKKPIILLQEKKILKYESYANPANHEERLTTGCKITYNPMMNNPIVVEVSQGYAKLDESAEGAVKFRGEHDIVTLKKMLTLNDFISMLEKCVTFADAMISQSLKNYYDLATSGYAEKRSTTV